MDGIFGFASLMSIFSMFFAQIDLTQSVVSDINKQEVYVGAQYTAEAAINKQLFEIKSEDIDSISKYQTTAASWKKSASYDYVNQGAESRYFDAKYVNQPESEIDMWDTPGGDVTFKDVSTTDVFNSFVLSYNKTSLEDVLVTITSYQKRGEYERCDFEALEKWLCDYIKKVEINTADGSKNGTIQKGYQVFFDNQWENGFKNRVVINGISSDFYNYRITFSSLSGKNTQFGYYVMYNGEKKKVSNNMVEIDTIGNAIENFSRMKIQKKITDQISPMGKYVLFSSEEVQK